MKNLIPYLYISILLSILTICLSCERMIDVNVPANQIDNETVFQNVETADAALSGIYANLWNNSLISGDKSGLILSLYTDDLDFYALSSTNGMGEVYKNQIIGSNPIIYNQWSSSYQIIYACNAVIEGCERSTSLNNTDKLRIKGEALLIRSLLFFYLQQIFGDIPYPITTDYQINQSLSKTSSDQVLVQLKNDLELITTLLPDQYRNSERIYVNKKVAQLLLSKVLITQSKWVEAANLLQLVIQNSLYQVQNDLSKTFKKTSSNIIWQLKPYNNGDAVKEVIAYYFDYIPPYNYALSASLISTFSSEDLRKQKWTIPVTVGGTTWYRAGKYRNLTSNTDEYSIVFRVEEAYLLLSESLAMQGKLSESLQYLNIIRLRSGLSSIGISITQSDLLIEILNENRREFFTEMGHRFFDMKRMKNLDSLIGIKPNWKPQYKLWPIPEQEILLNPHLNPQNYGY